MKNEFSLPWDQEGRTHHDANIFGFVYRIWEDLPRDGGIKLQRWSAIEECKEKGRFDSLEKAKAAATRDLLREIRRNKAMILSALLGAK